MRPGGRKDYNINPICGTLQDVVIGMSTLWDRVSLGPRYHDNKPTYEIFQPELIGCRNRDHLDVILTRARSNPLHVYIKCPPPSEILTLLSCRQPMISSLIIDNDPNSVYPDGIQTGELESLDMESLEVLRLTGISPEKVEKILNLALQSACQEMAIVLTNMLSITPTILKHDILERAEELMISGNMDEPFTSPKLRPSRLKSLRIEGSQQIFDVFDLKDSEVYQLAFDGDVAESIDPTSLPSGLEFLELQSVLFTSRPSHPHPLASLTTLKFGDATLEHPLQDYITLSTVEHLEIWSIRFLPSEDHTSWENPEPVFLGELPKLETISIQYAKIGSGLAAVLRSCQYLKSITVEECEANSFIESFPGHLADAKAFPSLETFCIIGPWPWSLGMSMGKFISFCKAQRPNLGFQRDGL